MLILRGDNAYIQWLAFAHDASALYAGHGYRGLWAWNLADRAAAPVEFGGERMTLSVNPLPGGRWALGYSTAAPPPGYNPLRLLDLAACTARPFPVFPQFCTAASHRLVGLGHSQYDEDRLSAAPCHRVYGFDLTADGPRYAWHTDVPNNGGVRAVTGLGADRFATADVVMPPAASFQWRLRAAVWRAADGAAEVELAYPHKYVHQLLGAPDGSWLVARVGMELTVWDATNWAKRPRVIKGLHKNTMTDPAAAFTPDGRFLLLANDGPSVLVYDAATWKVVRKWKWDVGVLRVVAVSPDGSLAAAAGPRGAIAVWDLDL